MVRKISSDVEDEDAELMDTIQQKSGLMSKREVIHELCELHRQHGQGEIKADSLFNTTENTEETEPLYSDFGAFSCRWRKPKDTDNYLCYSKHPLARVHSDGTIPKDICRMCEREQEQKLLNRAVATPSAQAYRQHHAKSDEEKLEFYRRKEEIRTAEIKKRRREGQSREPRVDWGNSIAIPDSYYYREQ